VKILQLFFEYLSIKLLPKISRNVGACPTGRINKYLKQINLLLCGKLNFVNKIHGPSLFPIDQTEKELRYIRYFPSEKSHDILFFSLPAISAITQLGNIAER